MPKPKKEAEDPSVSEKIQNQSVGLIKRLENQWWIDGAIIISLIVLSGIQLKSLWGTPDETNVFSAPMIPVLAGLLNLITGIETPVVITGIMLVGLVIAAPIFYLFILYLTKRRLSAIISAFLYILPIECFVRSRVKMAFLIGDGGHIVSLGLIPLIALPLLTFLRTGRFSRLVLASVGMGLVALTTLFGSLVGLMTLGVVAFSEFLQGQGRVKMVRFLLFVLLSAGLVSFWYNPVFVLSYFNTDRGQSISKTLWNLVPLSFVVIPVFGAFGFLLFEKKKQLQPLFIALGLTAMYTVIFFADVSSRLFPSHPRRYFPELGFSLAVLGGIVIAALIDYLHLKGRFFKYRLTPSGRRLAMRVLLVILVASLSLSYGLGMGSMWRLAQVQVLGLQAGEMALTSVWEARSRTGWVASASGYLISLVTICVVGLTWFKIKQVVGDSD